MASGGALLIKKQGNPKAGPANSGRQAVIGPDASATPRGRQASTVVPTPRALVTSSEPPICANPHVAVVVFKNRTDHVFGVGTRGILGRLPENAKPVVSAEPERSVPGKAEVMDPVQITRFVVGMQISSTEDALRSTGKDPSVRRFLNPKKRDIPQMKRFVHTFELVAMAPKEATVGTGHTSPRRQTRW